MEKEKHLLFFCLPKSRQYVCVEFLKAFLKKMEQFLNFFVRT